MSLNLVHLNKLLLAVLVVAFALQVNQASAADAVLIIENSVKGVSKTLTEEELLGMEVTIVNTENEFVDGITEFSGPLVRDVIGLIDNEDITIVTLIAANDYSVEVPIEDFAKYDVIFATFQNGVRLSPRDKGPIWVIYPMLDHPELQDRVYNDRLIWQLVKVSVK